MFFLLKRPTRTLLLPPLALLRSTEAVNEMPGDAVRRVFAATHLRRHNVAAPPAR